MLLRQAGEELTMNQPTEIVRICTAGPDDENKRVDNSDS